MAELFIELPTMYRNGTEKTAVTLFVLFFGAFGALNLILF